MITKDISLLYIIVHIVIKLQLIIYLKKLNFLYLGTSLLITIVLECRTAASKNLRRVSGEKCVLRAAAC